MKIKRTLLRRRVGIANALARPVLDKQLPPERMQR